MRRKIPLFALLLALINVQGVSCYQEAPFFLSKRDEVWLTKRRLLMLAAGVGGCVLVYLIAKLVLDEMHKNADQKIDEISLDQKLDDSSVAIIEKVGHMVSESHDALRDEILSGRTQDMTVVSEALGELHDDQKLIRGEFVRLENNVTGGLDELNNQNRLRGFQIEALSRDAMTNTRGLQLLGNENRENARRVDRRLEHTRLGVMHALEGRGNDGGGALGLLLGYRAARY